MKSAARWMVEFALPPVALLLIVIAVWDGAVKLFDIKPYLVPRPGQVLAAAAEHRAELARATALTAAAGLCGFSASLVAGTLVAVAFSQSKVIERSVYPYAIFLQTVPIVAVAPIIVTWFGADFRSVAAVAFIISVFPIITNATAGMTRIDPNLLDLFAVYNASRLETLVKLRLPAAVPNLVAGAKIACGLSIIGSIVGEFVAGFGSQSKGLGYLITATRGQLKTDYLFAAVLCSTLLGLAIFSAVSLAGSTILARWYAPAPKR